MLPDASYLYVPDRHVGGVDSAVARSDAVEGVIRNSAGAEASGNGPRMTLWMYLTRSCLRSASTAGSGRVTWMRPGTLYSIVPPPAVMSWSDSSGTPLFGGFRTMMYRS